MSNQIIKPQNLATKIFLDSGDPEETKQALKILGFLDGQTTNPSLFAKNPTVQNRLKKGEKFSQEEINTAYKKVVQSISDLIPKSSVSVEVYADRHSLSSTIIDEALTMNKWIKNAHIKVPITKEGLTAAKKLVKAGIRVNLTLCFSQEQAAAVYTATKGAKKGDVFISPFIGRLDDRGENGMNLIKNILRMYEKGDGHVEVLAASVRSLNHFVQCTECRCDIITAPLKILKEWVDTGMPLKSTNISAGLSPIPYREINLSQNWREYNISHELTDKGLEKFANDWNGLIKI